MFNNLRQPQMQISQGQFGRGIGLGRQLGFNSGQGIGQQLQIPFNGATASANIQPQNNDSGLFSSILQSFQALSPEAKWTLGASLLAGIGNMYAQSQQLEAAKDAQNWQRKQYERRTNNPYDFGKQLVLQRGRV